MSGADLAAIILAGGEGRRMGGVDKASLRLGSRRLVDRVADAVRDAGASAVTVVGPTTATVEGAARVRESPPGGGPLAAVAAALPGVDAPWTLLLACDLQRPDLLCRDLLAAWDPTDDDVDGLVLRDEDGRIQWLAGLHRTAVLRERLDLLGEPAGRPLRLLFRESRIIEVDAQNSATADIDTPDDLARARAQRPED